MVVAPTFPDEDPRAVATQQTDTEGKFANEPVDLAFVGRALERASAQRAVSCPGVFGKIERHVIILRDIQTVPPRPRSSRSALVLN